MWTDVYILILTLLLPNGSQQERILPEIFTVEELCDERADEEIARARQEKRTMEAECVEAPIG